MLGSSEKHKSNNPAVSTMRRLILEASEKELSKIGIHMPDIKKIKSLQLLHILKQDQEELAAVVRMETVDPTIQLEDVLTNNLLVEAKILDHEKNGKYTVFMRTGPILSSAFNIFGASGGYLFSPVEIRDAKVKICFLGDELQVKELLKRLSEFGIRFKVVSLTDASFSPDSPLNNLTDKQREALIAAHKNGYYDVPRRINSEQLAKKLGIGDSTLVEHLRKAEQRLINNIIAAE
jgi:hypothetical protein